MTIACDFKDDWIEKIPATTHINNSARVQTVDKNCNSKFHELINCFNDLSGIPVLLNTSFNIQGQPIVETPLDALSTFSGNGIDCLFLENYVFEK